MTYGQNYSILWSVTTRVHHRQLHTPWNEWCKKYSSQPQIRCRYESIASLGLEGPNRIRRLRSRCATNRIRGGAHRADRGRNQSDPAAQIDDDTNQIGCSSWLRSMGGQIGSTLRKERRCWGQSYYRKVGHHVSGMSVGQGRHRSKTQKPCPQTLRP